jgi:hypothetical protein
VRPNWFLRIIHFFSYGLPEFDPSAEDLPNAFESDIEKLPFLEMKIDILDSMVCMDSFDPQEIEKVRKSERANGLDTRRGTASRRQTTSSKPLAPQEDQNKSTNQQENQSQSNLTTLVCKVQKIEYAWGREQISEVKDQLAKRLKEYAKKLREKLKSSTQSPKEE